MKMDGTFLFPSQRKARKKPASEMTWHIILKCHSFVRAVYCGIHTFGEDPQTIIRILHSRRRRNNIRFVSFPPKVYSDIFDRLT
mmetsp:Transcript_8308/g.9771  ORF Transcript_8308/g.9771 Transcript_8308/m.9771 type:complete len:84 (+) Transcript_8308:144-395(+)